MVGPAGLEPATPQIRKFGQSYDSIFRATIVSGQSWGESHPLWGGRRGVVRLGTFPGDHRDSHFDRSLCNGAAGRAGCLERPAVAEIVLRASYMLPVRKIFQWKMC